jgi:hypothetical protein
MSQLKVGVLVFHGFLECLDEIRLFLTNERQLSQEMCDMRVCRLVFF